MLAISDQAAMLSLAGQVGSMIVASFVGRFILKSRNAIWLVSLLGAFGAMVAHVLVDGQGAFLLLFTTPLIYLVAVAGRRGEGSSANANSRVSRKKSIRKTQVNTNTRITR